MISSLYDYIKKWPLAGLLSIAFLWIMAGCNTTKHIPQGKYLLQNNTLKVKSDQGITRRGELNDQLSSLLIQKPNTRFLRMPYKVWLYNAHYKKYSKDTSAENTQFKLRTVERPVIYDSSFKRRSAMNMKNFLFNRGYFYTTVHDTTVFSGKKAYVTYTINTGIQYIIGNKTIVTSDSLIYKLVAASMGDTKFKAAASYSMTMSEEERSRLANLLRNNGYYNITQENIRFQIDTVNKEFLRNADNPFENAINFIALQRSSKKPTLDIKIFIDKAGKDNAFRRYKIGRVTILPDFADRTDFRDTAMIQHTLDSVVFRYHKYYVREKVLLSHNFLHVGDYYSQNNYDQTIVKLNELGIFQYVQLYVREDTSLPDDQSLRVAILLTPADRYDAGTNFEVSNGSNYTLGSNLSATYRNRNWLRGGNQLSFTLSGGIETLFISDLSDNFLKKFSLTSRNAGISTAISFPKFIAPVSAAFIRRFSQPRTIIGIGYNILDRQDYFTLSNVVASYTYNWQQNKTNTWDFSPAFVNIFRLPRIADTFQRRLDSSSYLRNSYGENFIEGESFSYTFSDVNGPNARRGYSYVKASIEEAGGLLSAINGVFSKAIGFDYSQYVKIDLDARHYFRRPHSTFATRLYGGFGIPYDKSTSLPYVKQYFVGGAYSIRGWRVRQLGPGSYYDSTVKTATNPIDRVGDIKLEANAEYRFDMFQLFGGGIHLNGALFTDAGNIWTAKPASIYPGGEFSVDKLGQDIAMSVGAGIRADVAGLFIIRVDGAFPIKKPYIHENSGWVVDQLYFDQKQWRSDNLVLNIAIGYPF